MEGVSGPTSWVYLLPWSDSGPTVLNRGREEEEEEEEDEGGAAEFLRESKDEADADLRRRALSPASSRLVFFLSPPRSGPSACLRFSRRDDEEGERGRSAAAERGATLLSPSLRRPRPEVALLCLRAPLSDSSLERPEEGRRERSEVEAEAVAEEGGGGRGTDGEAALEAAPVLVAVDEEEEEEEGCLARAG